MFVFNQFGDLERCALHPGNVHSADGWEGVLKPVVARYQGKVSRIYFRADAGFANPEVYEFLEAERIKYATRLPANRVLQERIGYLLKRPVGRPSHDVRRSYANFTYQAGSWTKNAACRRQGRMASRRALPARRLHPDQHGAATALHLRRIDPSRNMCRFYRLDVQPDLFGGVLLVKEWGRIGAEGRIVAEPYESEALAADALQRHADRKRRRGYSEETLVEIGRSYNVSAATISRTHRVILRRRKACGNFSCNCSKQGCCLRGGGGCVGRLCCCFGWHGGNRSFVVY